MAEPKKAVVVGDSGTQYHPLKGVDEQLSSILEGEVALSRTEDYDVFRSEGLAGLDLCISYADRWEAPLTPEQMAGILGFVAAGGGLLVIHNGISSQSRSEFAPLVGARFTGHPAYAKLAFQVSAPTHPIMAGAEPFEMEDEPYRFEFDSFAARTVLMQYAHDGTLWDAAWAREWGLGRVVYLAPGHTAGSFGHPAFRRIVSQSARWAMRGL